MKSKIKVYRSKPSNLSLNDEYMFKHEYFKVFEKFHIRNLYNVSVLNGEFFTKAYLGIKVNIGKCPNIHYCKNLNNLLKTCWHL